MLAAVLLIGSVFGFIRYNSLKSRCTLSVTAVPQKIEETVKKSGNKHKKVYEVEYVVTVDGKDYAKVYKYLAAYGDSPENYDSPIQLLADPDDPGTVYRGEFPSELVVLPIMSVLLAVSGAVVFSKGKNREK